MALKVVAAHSNARRAVMSILKRKVRCLRSALTPLTALFLSSFVMLMMYGYAVFSLCDLTVRSNMCYGKLQGLSDILMLSQDSFQPVGFDNTTFAYSAYVDDREAPDISRDMLPVVRIFTWTGRYNETVIGRWRCLLWRDGFEFPLETVVGAMTLLNPLSSSISVIPVMIICPFRNATSDASGYKSGDATAPYVDPFAVSLVTSQCEQPLNAFKLVDLRRRRSWTISALPELDYAVNFTVCVPPVFGNATDAADLVEFIEVNRVFGVQRFVFYVETANETVTECLEKYRRLGVVDVIAWTLPASIADVVFYHGQILAISECLYRQMYATKYLVSQDLDEFIVPTNADDWDAMLRDANRKYWWHEDLIASYSFRNRFFPLNAPDDAAADGAVDPVKRKYGPRTLALTVAEDKLFPWTERSKVMARPERIIIWHVHEIWYSNLVRQGFLRLWGDGHYFVSDDVAVLHHYRALNMSAIESTIRVTRMRHFESQVITRLAQAKNSNHSCIR